MSAPANWPINELVSAEEAISLSVEGRRIGLATPVAPGPGFGSRFESPVTVRDATGRLLRNVFACCESTGQVIQAVTDGNGNFLIANCRNEPQRAETFYPAPLQISYERPLNPDHPQPPAAPVPSSTADPATCHRSSDPA